jgi:hypothetical protein
MVVTLNWFQGLFYFKNVIPCLGMREMYRSLTSRLFVSRLSVSRLLNQLLPLKGSIGRSSVWFAPSR